MRTAQEKLHDGLSDMIEGGRLTEADIPEDYDWLVKSLIAVANDNTLERGLACREAGEAPFNDRALGNFDGIKQAD